MRELHTAFILALALLLLLHDAAAQTFSCTFEIDFCGMQQSQQEPTLYDWIRLQGRTPTSIGQNVPLTGPDRAFRGTYYAYIEASDPRKSGEYALLLTPSLNIIGPACLRFAGSMNGDHIGSLEIVRRENDNSMQLLRTFREDQGRNWFTIQMTVQMRTRLDQIGFIGTRGVDYLGDIAIDEVSVSRGVCIGGASFPTPQPPTAIPTPFPTPNPTPFPFATLAPPPQPVPGGRQDDKNTVDGHGIDKEILTNPHSTLNPDTKPKDPGGQNSPFTNAPTNLPSTLQSTSESTSTSAGTAPEITNKPSEPLTNKPSSTTTTTLSPEFNNFNPPNNQPNNPTFNSPNFPPANSPNTLSPNQPNFPPATPASVPNVPPNNVPNLPPVNQSNFPSPNLPNFPPADPPSFPRANHPNFPPTDSPSLPPANQPNVPPINSPNFSHNSPPGGSPNAPPPYPPASPENPSSHTLHPPSPAPGLPTKGSNVVGPPESQPPPVTNTPPPFSGTFNFPQPTGGLFDIPPRPSVQSVPQIDDNGNLPFRCDFEQSFLCGMENVNRRDFNGNPLDVFDWTRNTGSTPTSLTGPNSAYSGLWYMHVEASSPRAERDRAILLTPALRYQGVACVEFQYHMRGQDTGALYVYSTSRGQNNPLDRISGDQGDQWLQRQLEVNVGFNERIGFIGEVGKDIRGDIAIDSLEIRPGSCQGFQPPPRVPFPPFVPGASGGGLGPVPGPVPGPGPLPAPSTTTREPFQQPITSRSTRSPPQRITTQRGSVITAVPRPGFSPSPPSLPSLPYRCSFEADFCGMSQRQDDQFDWTRRDRPTETADTGPPGPARGNWFIYAEGSSPTNPRDRAILQTPNLMHDGEVCVHFFYSMNGVDVDAFIVTINNNEVIFQKTGNQGDRWSEENISVLLTRGDVIQFSAVRGPSYRSDIALDDIEITPGNCRGVAPSPTPEPPGSGFRDFFSCDVETDARQNSFCRLRQCTNDQFDWTRQSGRTPTGARFDRRLDFNQVPVTGPDGARQGSYYLFIEASGKLPQSSACLIVEGQVVENSGEHCLRFYYCMNGFHTGRLAIQQDVGRGLQDVWSLHGDQKEGWKRAAVDLDLTNNRQLQVFADVDGEFSGDISIDDLQITRGPCETTPSPYLWQCNFETRDGSATLCDMMQDKSQDTPNFDWSLKRDATASEFTGPIAAYNGQYYIYIEASRPRNPGDHAKILLPPLNFNGDVCVESWVHMYGFHTGSLEVFTRQGSVDIQRFMISGEQGNRWLQRRVTVENYRSDEQIGFRGIRGGEYSGDIALDNIQVRPGRC